MLWTCGQIIDGVQEFCDACWECSSRCAQCKEWFNKEQVGPAGLCAECENERMHQMTCYECSHDWTAWGFSIRCPKCESFNIVVGPLDELFYEKILEKKQIEYLERLQSKTLQSEKMMRETGQKERAIGSRKDFAFSASRHLELVEGSAGQSAAKLRVEPAEERCSIIFERIHSPQLRELL
ncbi:MAG: hypothetical protein L0Y80_00930 [Ignavibacteriae bacterium]|nr:hypothetical protein [Ignavibacteriota bacterium]